MDDRRNIELLNAIREVKGATATLWEYSSSLSELVLRVTWTGRFENLHLVLNGCCRIESSATWSDVDFSISENDGVLILKDDGAAFLVECSFIRVMRDVPPLYESS